MEKGDFTEATDFKSTTLCTIESEQTLSEKDNSNAYYLTHLKKSALKRIWKCARNFSLKRKNCQS